MDYDNFSKTLLAFGSTYGIVLGLLRVIFLYLDTIIYLGVAATYNMAIQMYDLNGLIDKLGGVITTIKQTIYSFLAVVMFFRIAFSMLEMLIDPTKIEDKQKGMGKIVSNVIVCILLIIAMPVLFEQASTLQNTIIEKKIIEKTVYGNSYSEDDTLGNRLALSCWKIFLKPNIDDKGSKSYKAWQGVFESTDENWKVWELAKRIDAVNYENNDKLYDLSYIWLASTALGLYLLWTMIKFAIDIAYRALKLIALEMISPIAIISYIDPKSSKDGVFSKWVKEVVKTYLALFIRIFTIAIASLLLGEIANNLEIKGFMQNVIVILAVISFIKTAPKFFDSVFGTELAKESDTKFGADMLKKLGGAAAIGTAAGIGGLAAAKKLGYSPGRGAWEGFKSGSAGGWKAAKNNDLFGAVKAGNGADAMRKYYGLPTKAEARKAQTEADLAKKAADDFTAIKNKEAFSNIDKKELFGDGSDKDKSFNKYINDSSDPADAAWKSRWNNAKDDNERREIKREYADAKFNAKKGDPKAATELSKLSDNRSAQYRASYGTEAAIRKSLDPAGEIAMQWIDEEKWGRAKIVAEQEASNWQNLVERSDTSRGYLYSSSDNPDVYYDSENEMLSSMGISAVEYDSGVVSYTYGGSHYASVNDAAAAAGKTVKRTGMGEFQKNRDKAKENIAFAEKKKDDAAKAKEEALKNPNNAAEARKAKLILAGKARGY